MIDKRTFDDDWLGFWNSLKSLLNIYSDENEDVHRDTTTKFERRPHSHFMSFQIEASVLENASPSENPHSPFTFTQNVSFKPAFPSPSPFQSYLPL